MKYNQLSIKANKKPTRVGRGISAGKGKTAGRGTKGQNSRTGGRVRPGFEGGQMPLAMRLPKLRGFSSKRTSVEEVLTSQINSLSQTTISNAVLAEAQMISNEKSIAKVIYDKDLDRAYKVSLQGASSNAQKAIEKAGGSFVKVNRIRSKSSKIDTK